MLINWLLSGSMFVPLGPLLMKFPEALSFLQGQLWINFEVISGHRLVWSRTGELSMGPFAMHTDKKPCFSQLLLYLAVALVFFLLIRWLYDFFCPDPCGFSDIVLQVFLCKLETQIKNYSEISCMCWLLIFFEIANSFICGYVYLRTLYLTAERKLDLPKPVMSKKSIKPQKPNGLGQK